MADSCGLCLQDLPLVKSHIIPSALLIDGQELPDAPLVVISNAKGPPVTRSQTGVYSRIVCGKCEDSFHTDDEYLIGFVRALPNAPLRWGATDLSSFDLPRLRRSFLSVLFRAHLSPHEVYKRVSLGRFYEPLRQFIHSTSLDAPNEFAVHLRHLPTYLGKGIFCPVRERWNGVNAYRFYVPHVTAMIKVDKRTMMAPWPKFALVSGEWPLALRSEQLAPAEAEVLSKLITPENNARVDKIYAPFRVKNE